MMSETENAPSRPDESGAGDLSFEQALRQLEEIVRKLESGDAPLDDAIALYTKGDTLRSLCQKRLDEAQMKIEKLRIDSQGQVTGSDSLDG